MAMEDKTRKALNFDLLDKALKAHYPSNKNYKQAWKDLGRQLKDFEFIHRQYSGYVSKNNMTYQEVNEIMKEITNELSWLKDSIRYFDVTAIHDDFDLLRVIKNDYLKSKTLSSIDEE